MACDLPRDVGQDRRRGGAARSVRHVPVRRGGDSTAAVRGDPTPDRRPAAEATADMTLCVIAAAGFRRLPGSRHLPNERLQIPHCTLAGSPTRRASYLKSPIWIVGSRFPSIRNGATVFAAWEEPSGTAQFKNRQPNNQKTVVPTGGRLNEVEGCGGPDIFQAGG